MKSEKQYVFLIGDYIDIFSDGGHRSILRTPNPTDGFSAVVEEKDLYLMFYRQHDSVTCDLSSFAELDAGDSFGGNSLFPILM